ncbi:hypothetical protein [Thermaerobacillus caldiproteolyticus]|uniref:Uncharacterized protein n=1 Tax=Thermaerobacillus caldiproteolyticus TaxID=247480 RepID=A0A7W0BYU0_9BACL|nr:hypothetical protein [Anoxybacillus caldiproteolyticus]MBA2873806.1 hypothetical protein [Anoxybacillus caldiproteolyticus]QPA30363.1 hypothetical protein ISX45_12070 [Anoxybacillus caldiproteolyticus]
MEKNDKKTLYYDEEAVQTISEQITDAYHSGVIEQEEAYYHPKREIGE